MITLATYKCMSPVLNEIRYIAGLQQCDYWAHVCDGMYTYIQLLNIYIAITCQ